MISKHEIKNKRIKSSDVYDTHKKQTVSDLSKQTNKTVWWKEENKDEKSDRETQKMIKGDPDISASLPPGGKKLSDIPDQMGTFETKTVGTIMVGFDRYNKKGDLGFTVVSDKDKDRKGIPERDEDDSNTYFGGNFDGGEKPFKAGAISFRYNKKEKEIDKIEKEKNENSWNDEENLLYQDEKEDEKLERLRKEKMSRPNEVIHLEKENRKTEKIRDNKRKENDDFLKEIKEFIEKLKNGKIKMLIESDEVAKRRKRIIELSSNPIPLEEMRRMLKEIFDEELAEVILADLLIKAKVRGLDERELLKIVKDLKKEVLR